MMKLFGYSTRLDSEETTDKIHLLTEATFADDRHPDDNDESDEEEQEQEEEEEDHEGKASKEHAFMCENCLNRAKETDDTGADFDVRMCTVSSADVIEVCVVTDEGRESKEKKKKKKKPLKKRVRKGVWRAMRSSWKYLRRGMSGYAPGLAAIFTWGVNFNQAVPVRTFGRSRY